MALPRPAKDLKSIPTRTLPSYETAPIYCTVFASSVEEEDLLGSLPPSSLIIAPSLLPPLEIRSDPTTERMMHLHGMTCPRRWPLLLARSAAPTTKHLVDAWISWHSPWSMPDKPTYKADGTLAIVYNSRSRET
jgi:hypothetical protein